MNPIYVEEIADVQCSNPQCTDPDCSKVLVLMPTCHPRAGVHVEYHKADGTLRTSCDYCSRPILSFKIANLPQEKKQ